ncbi:hypothetical protein SDC9_74051 [bioreactor metagenome]|uniref:Uncharacterized protein n=1 Tax=bioreactor metagenome TaxID=1076179 RepID=A0A644YGT5_9ZZZZ
MNAVVADAAVIAVAARQIESFTGLIVGHLISSVGHKTGGIMPPLQRRGPLPGGFRGGLGALLQRLHHILPQGTGGRGCADLRQKPIVFAGENNLQRGVVFCGDGQLAEVASGADSVVALYWGQQLGVGGQRQRICKTLPGIYKIIRRDRLSIGPAGAAQVKGIGCGTVGILFHIHTFCHTLHRGGVTAGTAGHAHQVFIKTTDHRIVCGGGNIGGVKGGHVTSCAHRQNRRRLRLAAAAQRPGAQHRGQRQSRPSLHSSHVCFSLQNTAPGGAFCQFAALRCKRIFARTRKH